MSDDPAFARLARTIRAVTGVDVAAYKDRCVRRRIAVRMRATGSPDFTAYDAALAASPAEAERLRDALTINVTRFYRNAETWELLRAAVLPALAAARGGRLRGWSAGCASGEEAYTLAMLLVEASVAAGGAGDVSVEATDLDAGCLARLREGRYPRAVVTELPAALATRWLEADGADAVRVVAGLRARVHGARADLTADDADGPAVDLIACRNVLIYLERAAQDRVLATFHRRLAPGGILVLGKAETLLGDARQRFEAIDARERVFRRAA